MRNRAEAARVTLSAEATAEPNSKTVISAGGGPGRRTSTAPFMPGTSEADWVLTGSGFWVTGLELGSFLVPSNHEKNTHWW